MIKKLLLLAALFCSAASAMDHITNKSGGKPKKRARTVATITPRPVALPWPLTPAALSALQKKEGAQKKSRAKARGTSRTKALGNNSFELLELLCTALETDQPVTEIERIITLGADINAPYFNDEYGNTPLIIAARASHRAACLFLLQSGANVNGPDRTGNFPLHWVTDPQICTLLLQKGAEIEARDKNGATPLHCAAAEGHTEICRILLQKGAHANSLCLRGALPLHDAANIEICELLIEHGANIDAKNQAGETPLYCAAKKGNVPVYRFLKEQGADMKIPVPSIGEFPSLCAAAHRGDRDACRLLLEMGVDINAANHAEGNTALLWALYRNHDDVVTLLLEAGANVNAASKFGETPLHVAVRSGRATLATLIERGAVVNAINSEGDTPLHRAASSGDADSCTRLLENRANVNLTNNHGKTPLHRSLVVGSELTYVITDPLIAGNIGSRYAQTFVTLLRRGAFACIIPPLPGDGTSKKRIFTALCTLRRFAQRIRLPREVSYRILASNKELRDDLLCVLLPRVQRNVDNNTLAQTLKTIPLEFHDLIIVAVYQHTMAQLKETMAKMNSDDAAFIAVQFGKMMYHGIAQMLGAQVKVTPEPEQSLFAV